MERIVNHVICMNTYEGVVYLSKVCSENPQQNDVVKRRNRSLLEAACTMMNILKAPMFLWAEALEQSQVNEPVPSATEINAQVVPPGTSLSTTIAQDAPSTSASSSTSDMHHPVQHQVIAEEPTHEDPPINHVFYNPSHNLLLEIQVQHSHHLGMLKSAEPNQVNYPPDHLRRWTKDHPLENLRWPSLPPVSPRKQLASDACGASYPY
ncbi:hypothetical protein Tco_1337083 [Tanacetum coccineum]